MQRGKKQYAFALDHRVVNSHSVYTVVITTSGIIRVLKYSIEAGQSNRAETAEYSSIRTALALIQHRN